MIIWYTMFANRFQSNFPHFSSIKLKLMRYVTLVLAVCIQILNDDSGVLYNNAAHLDICAGRHVTHMSKTHT